MRFLAFPITLFAAMLISVVPVSAQTVPARGAEPSSANHPVASGPIVYTLSDKIMVRSGKKSME